MKTDSHFVKSLIDLVAEEQIAELYASGPNGSIRLLRRFDVAAQRVPVFAADRSMAPAPESAARGDEGAPARARPTYTVTAPMAGTFHRSTRAGGEPW